MSSSRLLTATFKLALCRQYANPSKERENFRLLEGMNFDLRLFLTLVPFSVAQQ
jgi:hypothetical protein